MIFQHTHEAVMNGTKTQTRRLVKPDHNWLTPSLEDSETVLAVWNETLDDYIPTHGPNIYAVGQTKAVQPGRGKSAVGRIRITAIRREDVRQISDSDVTAEGFASREDFLRLWEQMHGPHYDAWVLTFERVGA